MYDEHMLEICEMSALIEDELFKKQNVNLLADLENKNVEGLSTSKEKILSQARYELDKYVGEDGKAIPDKVKDEVIDFIEKDLWNYSVIDPLIQDNDVSDIKIYDKDHIQMKALGERKDANISFLDEQQYSKFILRLLERNHVNLGAVNSIQTFTDDSQPNFILRVTVISALLTDSKKPCVAIRKIARKKMKLNALYDKKMFSVRKALGSKYQKGAYVEDKDETFKLMRKLVNSKGILFTGKGASGKTTLMNALIAEIPYDESVMICQENSELFDNDHPDILSTHVMTNNGDSKISYDLGELTRASLLFDLDRIIVGETKEGSEAAGLSKASMTGHKCWTSVHGESCAMAVSKMADYISQANGYSIEESLRQLLGFSYVVHLRNFCVDEIVEIRGWDSEKKELILKQVYPMKKG